MLNLKSVNFEQQQFQTHCLKQSHAEQTEWSIGRNNTCDLVLPSPEVSRIHGRIVYIDSAYYYIDDGSTSGSLINGESIPINDNCQLHPGDLLQIGETFLHVETLTPPSLNQAEADLQPSFIVPEQQWAGEDLLCRCCRIVDETPDVKTFSFAAEPGVLFHYQPGQFVNLEIEIEGKSVMRSYSISSSPTRPYHLSLTIKRVPRPADQPELPAGWVSNWMHDHLKVGDRVRLLGGALGNFTCLPKVPPKMLLISAGSGITPMMSMSRWVQDSLIDCDILFLHSARTLEDIVFRAELESITAQMPNFQLAITLTQQSVGRAWMGLTGRISQSMLQFVVPDLSDRAVYVCGPAAFMQSVRSLLETLQFPMQNYQEESFGGTLPPVKPTSTPILQLIPVPELTVNGSNGSNGNGNGSNSNGSDIDHLVTATATSANEAPVIHFIQSEREVTADEDASILEIAEQEGIAMRYACRVGACGACKVRVNKGQVRYDTTPTALTAADQQAGLALACIAYPINHVEIEA